MTKKERITSRMIRASEALDQSPWAAVIFAAVVTAMMIACFLAYNSVVPAYQ